MSVAAILLAAGASARMGGVDKLMQTVRGMPLILDRWHILASPTHGSTDRIVVLRADRPDRVAAMERVKANVVLNPAPEDGMASSIRAGLAAVPDWCTAALILPADMPDITQSDIGAVKAAHATAPRAIIRGATKDGRQGHPVLFPRAYFPELLALTGDEGARSVLMRHMHDVHPVTLPGDNAICDLDTPEDWDTWRKANA